MCGVAGIFTLERPVNSDLVTAVLRMLDAEVHRGPNDWGILLPDEAMRDPEILAVLERRGLEHVMTYPGSAEPPAAVLGNRRLSILDLSPAGRMPMGSPHGRIWTTYNGEIYNFPELRGELESRGYRFHSRSDTEVLLYGYEEWGPEVVHRLRGMFAFAVLDVRRPDDPKLFLARDRFGIKPLYWARRDCVFQFASEVRALVAGQLVADEPEPRGFHGFLVYGSVPTPWTTVRDLFSLPAAHSLEIDDATYSLPTPRCYWRLPEAGSSRMSRAEAVTETRRLLEESVGLHLVSDVPAGVFLSGGMDSSALVALAARHRAEPLTTLCVTFDEAQFSEADKAARIAREYGTKHIEVRLSARDFVDEIPRILRAMDQPSIDGVNTYFVAKAARDAGLTVVLSGVGGDEIFWGYEGFRRAPRIARLAALPGVPLAALALARLARSLGVWRLEKLEFLREAEVLGSYLVVRGLFPTRAAARLLGAGRLPLWTGSVPSPPMTGGLYGRLEIAHYLQDQLLRDIDVFGMAHGLEVRVPFLDHRLAEMVVALPEEYLTPAGVNKPLLAAAVRDLYPPGVAGEPKKGFTFPFEHWMRQAWHEIRLHTEHPEPIRADVGGAVVRAFRGKRLHWSRAWAVAVLSGMRRSGALPSLTGAAGPRRILFLLPEAYASPGGIQRYGQALVQATAEAFPRAELRVLSLNDTSAPARCRLSGRIHFWGAGPRTRPLHKARFVARALGQVLRRRPSLIICGHINLMPLAGAVGRLTGVPTAVVAYGIEAWDPTPPLRRAFWRAQRVVAISRFTATRMLHWGLRPDRVAIVPNPVDGDIFRPVKRRAPARGLRLLTVSRLNRTDWNKGVERVLRVLPELRRHEPELTYVIVGNGDDLPRLQTLASELGLGDSVEFRPDVPDQELARIYSEADLFILPSTEEGFGFVFLEALACGTPVIAGNRDASAEPLLDGRLGRLVDPYDETDLVQGAIASLEGGRRDPARRDALRRETLRAYGFESFRERVRETFRDP